MAQVRLKREGRVVFDRTVTFDREQAAQTWIVKTEKEMAKPGAIDAARKPNGTLADLIDRYLATSRRDVGRTKAQVLAAIKTDEIAECAAAEITSADLVGYAERLGFTRKPQTVQNYLSHLALSLQSPGRLEHGP
jgi:hypothetical protein